MDRNLYRIIDANFNRAREAARLIEEFCRFVLNSAPLTERAKQIRHDLSACLTQLDAGRLIAARDTAGDVAANRPIDQRLQRTNLNDSLTAACKRLPEAIRTLAEITQTLNPSLAQSIEELRYRAYSLEKDIVIFSDPFEKFKSVELYIVISSNLPAEVFSITQQCIAGKADCIQLRAKDIEDDRLLAMAEEFVQICKEANILSVINDRVDIAVLAGADGVHLGQNDLSIEQARRIQTAPLIIGQSTHSPDQLSSACRQRPTYVGLGPIFATPTKPGVPAVGMGYITEAVKIMTDTGITGVAIGGITKENIGEVLEAGAEKIAVCSAVTQAPDPAQACRELKQAIFNFKKAKP